MKICPECALTNEERFPACVVCHASLADVRSTPSSDPAHPEHARRALAHQRGRIARRQLAWAVVCYVLFICGLTVWPGGVPDLEVGMLYVAGALFVALAVASDWLGGFPAATLQAAMSVTLILVFGPSGVFSAFVLAGHVVAPMMLHQWVEMIHDAYR